MTLTRRIAAGAAVVLLALPLTACGGDDDPDGSSDGGATPEEAMATAKAALDETSGVELSLSTQDERADGDFLKNAQGVITDAPAFQGTAGGRFLGFDAEDVEVRSVDGDFYVNAPIIGWDTYDPAELCAPDPATLLDPDTGVSNVLVAATDLSAGDKRRAEDDNSVIVTPYDATVPGTAVSVDPALRTGRVLRRDVHRRRGGSPARRRPDRRVLLRRRRHHLHDRDHRLRHQPGDHRPGVRLPHDRCPSPEVDSMSADVPGATAGPSLAHAPGRSARSPSRSRRSTPTWSSWRCPR